MYDIPLLTAADIECRVQSVKAGKDKTGAILLLYKDARCDMRILDQVFGQEGWQRTHEIIGGNLFCNIDIWDNEKQQWIRKQDVGVESNTEKEKGQASDAFKRAGTNVGIGRELYTSPFIWVTLTKEEVYEQGGATRLSPRVKFTVREVGYNDRREISRLVIVDQDGKARYSFGTGSGSAAPKEEGAKKEPVRKKAAPKDAAPAQEPKDVTAADDAYEAVMTKARIIIATIIDAETATAAIPEIMALQHVGTSKRDVGRLLNETTKALHVTYDVEKKAFVEEVA